MKWNIMLNYLYLVYYKWKNKKKAVVFAKGSKISSEDYFEGNNYIAGSVLDSYVGFGSYISDNCYFRKCKIGKFCSIASGVKMLAGQHPIDFVSTSPAFHLKKNVAGKSYVQQDMFNIAATCNKDVKYRVIIGNDVWIGQDVLLFPGVSIGDGAVIGAGALVNRDIPPYSVWAGVPARMLKYRFKDEQIQKLQEIKWWDKGEAWLYKHADLFSNIDRFLESIQEEQQYEREN